MRLGVNPFRWNDQGGSPGVAVPLPRAQSKHKTSPDDEIPSGVKTDDRQNDMPPEENGISPPACTGATRGLTLEALRAEVDADLVRSSQVSTYGRTFCFLKSIPMGLPAYLDRVPHGACH